MDVIGTDGVRAIGMRMDNVVLSYNGAESN